MKKGAITLLIQLAVSVFVFAQSPTFYSQISINLNSVSIAELAQIGIPVDHVHIEKNRVSLVVNSNDLELLNQNEINYSVQKNDLSTYYRNRNLNKTQANDFLFCSSDFNDTFSIPNQFNFGTMGGFLTYDEMLLELDSMVMNYPNLITVKQEIGTFRTYENRPIYYVKISDNPNIDESVSESKVLYTALHHAREPMSMMQLIYFMQYVLENYNTNSEIKYLVDNLELYFVPCVNPDGYVYNQITNPNGGGLWRKNRNDNGDGTFGVDLNRNYGFEWGIDDLGSSPSSSSDSYRGVTGFSEQETKAIKFLCDQNNFVSALNCHSYSNVLLWPTGFQNDSLRYSEFADKITENNHYSYGEAQDNLGYTSNGDSDAWMYHDESSKSKIYAFTPEIGRATDGFWPILNRIIPLAKENIQANINLAESALDLFKVDMKSSYKTRKQESIELDITKIGLASVPSLEVSIVPNSDYSVIGQSSYFFNSVNDLETKQVSFNYNISDNIKEGEEIKIAIKIQSGSRGVNKEFYRVLNTQLPEYFQNYDQPLTDWDVNSWGITSKVYSSYPNSITDSPKGNYSSNANNELVLTSPISLQSGDISRVYLKYKAKWETEDGFDYVQLIIDDGINQMPICGNYTNSGVAATGQPEGEPLYDGSQNEWIEEYIDLSSYIGKVITVKFVLKSDGAFEKDGFYLDDFNLYVVKDKPLSNEEIIPLKNVDAYPNPTSDILYVNSEDKVKISIVNLIGQTVLDSKSNYLKFYQLNVSSLESGVYFLRIENQDSETTTKKIIIK